MLQSHLTLLTPWTVALQAPLPLGFSRQEYWSGLSCPPPGYLPDPGIEHKSPTGPALQEATGEALILVAAAAKSLLSCQTLCDPIDGSPPGSPVPGILQARTLEWVAIFFSYTGLIHIKCSLRRERAVPLCRTHRHSITPWGPQAGQGRPYFCLGAAARTPGRLGDRSTLTQPSFSPCFSSVPISCASLSPRCL